MKYPMKYPVSIKINANNNNNTILIIIITSHKYKNYEN